MQYLVNSIQHYNILIPTLVLSGFQSGWRMGKGTLMIYFLVSWWCKHVVNRCIGFHTNKTPSQRVVMWLTLAFTWPLISHLRKQSHRRVHLVVLLEPWSYHMFFISRWSLPGCHGIVDVHISIVFWARLGCLNPVFLKVNVTEQSNTDTKHFFQMFKKKYCINFTHMHNRVCA